MSNMAESASPGSMPRAERAMSWVVHHPALVVALLLLASLASVAAIVLRGVRLDNAVEVWFVEGDPELAAYRRFQREFVNDEVAIVAFSDPGGVLQHAPLARIVRLGEQLGQIPGISRVLSLATTRDIRLEGDTLEVAPLLTVAPEGEQALAELRDRIAAEPLVRDQLLDPSGHTTVLLLRMEPMQDIDRRRHEVLTRVEEVLGQELGPRSAWQTAGIGVIYDALNQASSQDAGLFMGLALLLIFTLVALVFRKPGPLLLAVAQVSVSSLLAVGLFVAAGRSFNMVTMLLPTLVLVYGILDAVHILAHLSQELARRGGVPPTLAERRALVARGMAYIARPALLTSVTTAIGFGSLVVSQMSALRELGLFAGLGILIDWLVTMSLLGALLPYAPLLPRPASGPAGSADWLGRTVSWLSGLAVRRHRAVLVCCGLLLLCGAAGIARIEADTFSIGFFPDSHPVRRDSDRIEASYGFYTPLEFTVSASGPDGVLQPDLLQGIARWQRAMERDPVVSRTLSLADLVAKLNMVLGDGRPESRKVPDDPDRIAQALAFYAADPENERALWVTADDRRTRVTTSVKMMSAGGIDRTIQRLLALAGNELPPGTSVEPSGYLPLYVRMMDYVVQSQVTSFALAFGVVFLLIGFMFRSVRVVALSILPNLLPVFVTIGLMGWAGIRLDVATVTIAPIVIGVAVDNTIYFFHHYLARRGRGLAMEPLVQATIHGAGRAMLASSLILACGFAILTLATVRSVVFMGLLTSVSVAAALLGDLVVLPAQMVLLKSTGPRGQSG